MEVHSIILQNSLKLQTTQIFINGRINQSIVAQSHDGILCSSEKEQTTATTCSSMDDSHQCKVNTISHVQKNT